MGIFKYLLNKRKLLIITGAGASIESGICSVKDIDSLFENKASAQFMLDTGKNLYQYVRDTINNYYLSYGYKTDYEEVLYILFTLASLEKQYNPNPLNAFISNLTHPKILENKTYRNIISTDFNSLAKYLIDELLKELRIQSSLSNKNMDIVKDFFRKIGKKYKIGFITTNHDNIITQSFPRYFTGFNKKGFFNKSKVLKRKKWNFSYYIHGSIHFDMKQYENELHQIVWKKDISSTFSQNSMGRSGNITMEGLDLPNSTIVAGYDKLNQIQREPFRSYYNKFENVILKTDIILIIGYGFNDYHLNNILETYTKIKKNNKIVIISFSDDSTNSMQFRHDQFSNNLV